MPKRTRRSAAQTKEADRKYSAKRRKLVKTRRFVTKEIGNIRMPKCPKRSKRKFTQKNCWDVETDEYRTGPIPMNQRCPRSSYGFGDEEGARCIPLNQIKKRPWNRRK
jgi:hypothetical protein